MESFRDPDFEAEGIMPDDSPNSDADRRARVKALIDGARHQLPETGRHRNRFAPRAINEPNFLPGYELLEEIHRGGQGVVYRARQHSTSRTVAIKIMREGPFGGPRDRARFEREVNVLATLNHPNIVGVLDSGTASGCAYIVMDYVEGVPLDEFASDGEPRPWGNAEVVRSLSLFAKVCDAVHAAHLRGIIHRDLKPNNVLVNATGEPHILDFGLAKLGAYDGDTRSGITVTTAGHFIGSLPWASPEQAAGESASIDVRTDVYSIGVMMYQLLTGRFPYSVVGNMRDVLDRIMTAEPAPMRTRAARLADDELATIVSKCLAKERERRYESAGELARDIRHYLADEPIEAKRDSAWYVLRKTLRRYRRRVAVGAAFVLLVTGAAVALSILYARQGRLLGQVQVQRDKAVNAERLAEERHHQTRYISYVANIAAAEAATTAGDGGAARAHLSDAPSSLRSWEWHYLHGLADQSAGTWQGPEDLITGRVRLSPDNHYVGASFWMEGDRGALRVWRRKMGETAEELILARDNNSPFEFLPDGRRLLYLDRDGNLLCFDLEDHHETKLSAISPHDLARMAFSPDGRVLVMVSEHRIYSWDAATGQLRRQFELPESNWTPGALDSTGNRVAVQSDRGTLSVWEVAGASEITRVQAHAEVIYGIAVQSDGHLIATVGGEAGEIKLWDLSALSPNGDSSNGPAPPPRITHEIRGSGHRVGIPSFTPDGTLLAAPSADKTVRLWNVADGSLNTTLLGHKSAVVCTDMGDDGRYLVSGDRGGLVKLWDLQQGRPQRVFRGLHSPVNSVAFTPNGRQLLYDCGTVHWIDAQTGKSAHADASPQTPAYTEALVGPDDAKATVVDASGRVVVWSSGNGESNLILGAHQSIPHLATDPARRLLVSADAQALNIWDWSEGRTLHHFAGPGDPVLCVAINSNGSLVALGLSTGDLVLQNAQTGASSRIDSAHRGSIADAAFRPHARTLATASEDGTVKLWDVDTGRVIWNASPHLGDVWCVAFNPDGTRLIAGGRDRTVRIFDPDTGRELLALRGPTGTVMSLAFSPDGNSIAAGTWAREIFVWDANPD
jgi:WD40 repeat protein/predicted Ser/Thr protein kinase